MTTYPNNDADHGDIVEIAERARQAMAQHNWVEASHFWEIALQHLQPQAGFYLEAAKALREAGRDDKAEDILQHGIELFPNNAQIAISHAWLANARNDWETALHRWETLRTHFPENPWCCLGNIAALRGAGRDNEIEPLFRVLDAILSASRERGLDPAFLLKLEMDIAKAKSDWGALRTSAESLRAIEANPSAQTLLALAQACWHLGQRDEADHASSHALEIEPALSEAVVIQAWVATERGDGETALSCYRRLVELNPGTVRWSLKAIQLMNRLGRVKEALQELEKVRRQWPTDPMVRLFLQNFGPASQPNLSSLEKYDPGFVEEEELRILLQRTPDASERKRPLIHFDGEKDVLIGEVSGAQSVVLIFAGSNDAVSMPLPLFDHFLAAVNITAIYLKDFNRLRFLSGIQSLHASYEGTIANLKEMLQHLGIKHTYTIGNCDGGFAAIRYGIELDAKRIITFGAPTHSPAGPMSKIEHARNFMSHRLAAKVPAEMMDLKAFLEGRRYSTRIDLFYEHQDERDGMQAQHLAGLPGVHLNPQPGLSNHYMLRQMALKQSNFRGMLEGFFTLETTNA